MRTHSTLAMLLRAAAAASSSRRALVRELVWSVSHRGGDPAQLLGSPGRAMTSSRNTVDAYSIGPSAIATVRGARVLGC